MSISFCFGIHSHQPVGNFDFVFEEAYEKAYLPFLKLLERYPAFRTTLHYSGSLLEWLEKHKPEFFELLWALVKRGQVELLTGGMYEPILPAIPERDKIGQIRKLTAYLNKHFGVKPTGAWITERVWEPHLPKALAQAGVEYVILDDTHFKYAGLTDDQLHGYYVTDEEGYSVKVFPISKKLRYAIPFQPVEETIEYLRAVSVKGGGTPPLHCYADDGEKFGGWPGTYKHCYESDWLEKFFAAITQNSDWIHLLTYGEAAKELVPLGKIYLPTASYAEMLQWALPAEAGEKFEAFEKQLKETGLSEDYGQFVRGGHWRNFLAKYPEANQIHKKMLRVREKIERAEQKKGVSRKKIDSAWTHLYRAQDNDPYWHGVFGGLYLPHLRSAAYENLLKAEAVAESTVHGQKVWLNIEETDFDLDGQPEILVETPQLNLAFSPHKGGTLFEMDYKPKSVNFLDTLTRRKEAYHSRIDASTPSPNNPGAVATIHERIETKEQDLEKVLAYDWYRRAGFIDHFLGPGCTLEDFARARYPEEGDFVNQPYEAVFKTKGQKSTVTFKRDGKVWVGSKQIPLRVEKELTFEARRSGFDVSYRLSNLSDQAVELWFGMELNLGLLAPNAPDRYVLINSQRPAEVNFAATGSYVAVRTVALVDEWRKVQIELGLKEPVVLWRFPIYTVSLSEGGMEKVFQAASFLFHRRLTLAPQEQRVWLLAVTLSSL